MNGEDNRMADPDEVPEIDPESPKGLRARIEEANRRAAEAEQKNKTLERGLAISRARLDGLSEKQLRALDAAHEGDYTPDALKATADELGFVWESSKPPPAAEEPDRSNEARELSDLAGSTVEHGAEQPQKWTQEAFNEKVNSFKTEAELDAFLSENRHLLNQNE